MTDTFPTADIVAVAIVTASRETGANPLRVASGQRDAQFEPMVYETSRARAYAAMALKASTIAGVVAIGRMVGSGQPDVYLTGLAKRVATRKHAWWSERAFERVCAAIAARSEISADQVDYARELADEARSGWSVPTKWPESPASAPAPLPAPKAATPAPRLPRPAASPGKRKLEDILREAVQTTQSMTPPPEEP